MPRVDVFSKQVRASASLAFAFAVLSLAGCAMSAPPPPPSSPPPPQPVVAPPPPVKCDPAVEGRDLAARHLLATQDRLGALYPTELAAEAARVVENATVEQQMDQALALSMTRNPGDLARAQALLDQVLRNSTPGADAWRPLARLLAYRLGEQKRAEDAAERGAQQLRDAQRDNQRKLDEANAKLEALMNIERSLNTRPSPAAPSSAPASKP